ncbi:MAG: hypothetical protein HY805_06185 [Nitrospirae bacterium]|nr:hypothetical protein [Nitrospirota bacterium]
MEQDLIEKIRSLESRIEDRDALIKRYDKEREILLKSVKKAHEDAEVAYERLADLDISRHAEISDLKQELDRLRAENKELHTSTEKEGEGFLKREVEVKKLQLQESEENLHKITTELKRLKDDYESLDRERDAEINSLKAHIEETEKAFIERLSEMSDETERLRTEEPLIKESDSRDAEITQLKAEVEGLTKENTSLRDSLSQMNSLLDELKVKLMDAEKALKDRTAEMEHFKNQYTDVLEEVKRLKAEKEDIEGKLKNSASETETLKNELQRLRYEKTEETTSLRAQLEDASIKVADMLEKLQSSISDNISAAKRLADASSSVMKTMALYPMVIGQQERKTGRKARTFKNVTIFIAVFTVMVVLSVIAGMYALKVLGKKEPITVTKKDSLEKEPLPIDRINLKKPYKMPWAGTREVIHKDFRAGVTFLSPVMMDSYHISPVLTEEQRVRNYFYVLEIDTEKGCIQPEVINSPFKAVSFINEDGSVFKTIDIPELDPLKKVVYKVKACKGKTGAVFFRYFMAISNVNNPQGIIVDGLIKDSPMVIK